MVLRKVDTYIAYRLGELHPDQRTKEVEQLPLGPRINLTTAKQLRLPDGTLFCDASEGQILQWFERLFDQAGVNREIFAYTLSGLDLSDFDERWWALNELLEIGNIRDAFEGKHRKKVSLERLPDALSHKQLEQVVREYGMGVTQPRQPNGRTQVYAQAYNSVQRQKIYLCSLSQLEQGQVTEQKVREKLGKRGLSVIRQKERKVA